MEQNRPTSRHSSLQPTYKKSKVQNRKIQKPKLVQHNTQYERFHKSILECTETAQTAQTNNSIPHTQQLASLLAATSYIKKTHPTNLKEISNKIRILSKKQTNTETINFTPAETIMIILTIKNNSAQDPTPFHILLLKNYH